MYDAFAGNVPAHPHETRYVPDVVVLLLLYPQSFWKPVLYSGVSAGHDVSRLVPENVPLHIPLLDEEPGTMVFGNAVGGMYPVSDVQL